MQPGFRDAVVGNQRDTAARGAAELNAILGKNMFGAVEHHLREWKYEIDQGFLHEYGHPLLLLCLQAPPREGLENHSYQSNFDSEIYVLAIQSMIFDTIKYGKNADRTTKERFIQDVEHNFILHASQENLIRTLSWLIGQNVGKSFQEIWIECGSNVTSLIDRAKTFGITLDERESGSTGWSVIYPTRTDYHFHYGDGRDSGAYLPDDVGGVTDFERFQKPDPKIIEKIYDRLSPALDIILQCVEDIRNSQRRLVIDNFFVQKVETSIGEILVSDLYAAICSRLQPTPATAPGARQS